MTDIPSGKVPVVQCVVASWRFFFGNWRQLLPAALVVSAVSGLSPLVLAAVGSINVGTLLLASLIVIAAEVVFWAVVLRKAVRNEFIRPIGLGFGQDEIRLIAVLASFALLLMPVAFVFSIIYTAVVLGQSGLSESELEALANNPEAANRMMLQAAATPPGALVCFIGMLLFALLFTRLYMADAATIGEKRIVFLQTWGWSKGNVTRIFAAIVMTALPAIFIHVLIAQILGGLAPASAGLVPIAATSFVGSLISILVRIPVTVLRAELYRGLRPPTFVAK